MIRCHECVVRIWLDSTRHGNHGKIMNDFGPENYHVYYHDHLDITGMAIRQAFDWLEERHPEASGEFLALQNIGVVKSLLHDDAIRDALCYIPADSDLLFDILGDNSLKHIHKLVSSQVIK